MTHRGEIFQKTVQKTGTNITKLAKHLGVTRRTVYKYFEDSKLDLDILISAGKFMKHDFSKQIPEISNPEIRKAAEENLEFKLKYFELLEKYVTLQEENAEYLKKNQKAS